MGFAQIPNYSHTTIEIDKSKFVKLPPLALDFARLHECAHLQKEHVKKVKRAKKEQNKDANAYFALRRSVELEADREAVIKLKNAGYNVGEIVDASEAIIMALPVPEEENDKYPMPQARINNIRAALGLN